MRFHSVLVRAVAASVSLASLATTDAAVTVTNPFRGVTRYYRTETSPRVMNMNIVQIDLTDPGIRFQFSPQAGNRETTRQRTADYLNQVDGQIGINTHFFLPVDNAQPNVYLAGFAASNGNVVSQFDPQPIPGSATNQNFAVVPYAPALNISQTNHVDMITPVIPAGAATPTSTINESGVSIYNAVAGSAQIVTNGQLSIPVYGTGTGAITGGLLTSGGAVPGSSPSRPYTNAESWYSLNRSRTSIGVSQDGNTLTLFTVDEAGGSLGMPVTEVAALLRNDYGVWNALNLDGGGSTTLAMEGGDGIARIVNASSDASGPLGRANGGNLAVFAAPIPEPASIAGLMIVGLLIARRRA